MTPERPILIVGAGIGGLALALALAQRGIAAHVVERRSELSEAGAGIQLSPNAVRVLEEIGVAPRLAARAGVPDALVVRDGQTGAELKRLPLGAWIAARHGAPYWVAHRRDLQAALAEAVRMQPAIQLTFGFDVRFLEGGDGVLRLVGPEKARISGAAIVGADGVFSRVRQQVHATRAPRWSGLTAARTMLPVEAVRDHLNIASTNAWLAHGAHVVHYPVRAGRELALVVIAPARDAERGWAVEATRESVVGSVASFAPLLRDALGRATSWRRWALYELDPLPRWSAGRVTVLGDAAHPTLPFLAQGGALALEDAAVLSRCLDRERGKGGPGIERAFAAYGTARRARAERIVAAARQNGRIFHLSGPLARGRNLALAVAPPERLMARWDWVYGWRPE
jgi:salicylate hydroxylase